MNLSFSLSPLLKTRNVCLFLISFLIIIIFLSRFWTIKLFFYFRTFSHHSTKAWEKCPPYLWTCLHSIGKENDSFHLDHFVAYVREQRFTQRRHSDSLERFKDKPSQQCRPSNQVNNCRGLSERTSRHIGCPHR